MKRLVLCALIGGGIGAGVAFARSDPTSGESEASNGMTNAAMTGAAGGALLGFVLDRRAKRKRRSALVGYADKARPKVDAAVEAAFSAAEVALPIIEARAAAARERAKETAAQAAGVAKERAAEAAGVAKERAAETAIHARHAAAERADLARHKAKKSGHPKAAKALDLLPV